MTLGTRVSVSQTEAQKFSTLLMTLKFLSCAPFFCVTCCHPVVPSCWHGPRVHIPAGEQSALQPGLNLQTLPVPCLCARAPRCPCLCSPACHSPVIAHPNPSPAAPTTQRMRRAAPHCIWPAERVTVRSWSSWYSTATPRWMSLTTKERPPSITLCKGTIPRCYR